MGQGNERARIDKRARDSAALRAPPAIAERCPAPDHSTIAAQRQRACLLFTEGRAGHESHPCNGWGALHRPRNGVNSPHGGGARGAASLGRPPPPPLGAAGRPNCAVPIKRTEKNLGFAAEQKGIAAWNQKELAQRHLVVAFGPTGRRVRRTSPSWRRWWQPVCPLAGGIARRAGRVLPNPAEGTLRESRKWARPRDRL
jgi:hypothetical protein